jgi:hypothetical protein
MVVKEIGVFQPRGDHSFGQTASGRQTGCPGKTTHDMTPILELCW